ncbi:MAG: 3-deoxy-D-manno-octulosonic acid transferase [Alphaproteobacteria bacterium]|nr:3-deoxy-D-manno-octulosonic acid transferase [Alphaproteobacteria bacterium]
MASRLPLTLRAYQLLTAAGMPLVDLLLSRRLKRGKELAERLPERRGQTKVRRPAGPLVWLHGASVGEVLAVVPLIERLRARDITVLVTSGTVTSAGLAERRMPQGVIHQFVPVDTPQFAARFLNHWRPDLALFVESDLWPNLILAASKRDVPLILVNGRISERSFSRWRLAPRTIGALLGRFDLCLAQSAEDAGRLSRLGALRVVTTGNLKLDVPAPPADDDKLKALKGAIGSRPVIAAASTHPGEEAALIDVHRRLKHTFPGLLTVLVPRHPERGQGVAEIARVSGLASAMRSRGELPGNDTEIYIADTLGELGLIYRIAPIVFIGGSLVGHGGQNPIEAAKLGVAILHGPHVWNFSEIYTALDAVGGAEVVTDSSKLTVRVGAWLKDAEARTAVAQTGLRAMDTLGGALDKTVAALDPYLMHFSLDVREDDA